jgi:basic membrane protein A
MFSSFFRRLVENTIKMREGAVMKKMFMVFFALCLPVVTIAFFSGCDGKNPAAWKPGDPVDMERIRIGVLYLTDHETETSGFTYEHHAGIKAMQRALGLRDDQISARGNIPDTDNVAIEHALREFAAKGMHIIFAVSYGYMDSCEKIAKEYPNVIFAHATGYKYNNTNFTNYYGKIHQARYLSGIVAGLQTKTNKIGYVAAMGMEDSQVSSGLNAFALGVESVNPDARILVQVTNNWFDPASESQAAHALADRGCDILAQHCDTSVVMQEAQKRGIWSIGYNSDMRREAPNAVLTSVLWHWEVYYTGMVRSVVDGSFTTQSYFGGMNEGLVGIAPLNETLVSPETTAAVKKAEEYIRTSDFNVFDGIMETNDGRRIGAAGSTLSELAIKRDIKWYYRTVIPQ